MSEKIQKVLANAGLGARREIETWIEAGRITVNGKLAKIGDRIDTTHHVQVDGRSIQLVKSEEQKTRVLLYHKPEGQICTRHDPEGRPTIFEALPSIRNGRWISVGRLDFNTSGLLLLTNNGTLANQLMHPKNAIEREYAVRIRGEVPEAALKQLCKGVQLADGLARFNSLSDGGGTGSNHWYHVTVSEGRNRLVRRLWEALGFSISRLIRVRFGSLHLPANLARGRYRELSTREIKSLEDA